MRRAADHTLACVVADAMVMEGVFEPSRDNESQWRQSMTDYSPWDEFLERWPLERVREMTLEDYSQSGNKDTFTYWLEVKLADYGSVWGGSAFKFGVFSRADDRPKESNNKRSYSARYAWYTRDGSTAEEAFEVTRARIVQVIEAVTAGNIEAIDQIDLGPAYKWKIAFHYQDRARPLVVAVFLHTWLAALCDEKPSSGAISHYHGKLIAQMGPDVDLMVYSRTLWQTSRELSEPVDSVAEGGDLPLNTIFYGPPGTGKTYTTINRALEIICRTDEALNSEIGRLLDDPQADRELLERRFFQLVDDRRITFLTFHPSFTYEDFVQGIRPVLGEAGEVAYEMKDGPFKRIADAARTEYSPKSADYELPEGASVYKMSLGNTLRTEDDDIYEHCMEKGLIAHGFGNEVDFSDLLESADWGSGSALIREKLMQTDIVDDRVAFATRVIWWFIREISQNDIIVVSRGNYRIRAIGRVTGEYNFDRDRELRYNHTRPVEWIVRDADIPVEQISSKVFSQQTLYRLNTRDIRLGNLRSLLAKPDVVERPRNYVMIVDEINRGNIPRIFGELITLIERDKRLRPGPDGRLTGYRVALPGALDDDPPFGVPENLYVIGTMNTADKSITTLDVALRRRFAFEPMYTKYELIEDDVARELLRELNKRIIEAKDRDHQIGHSYFMALGSDELEDLMNGKIVPLLEEYFFGDATKVLELFDGLDVGGGSVKLTSTGALRFERPGG